MKVQVFLYLETIETWDKKRCYPQQWEQIQALGRATALELLSGLKYGPRILALTYFFFAWVGFEVWALIWYMVYSGHN